MHSSFNIVLGVSFYTYSRLKSLGILAGLHAFYDFEGWLAYTKNASTYKLRKKLSMQIEKVFPKEISAKELGRYLKIRSPAQPFARAQNR